MISALSGLGGWGNGKQVPDRFLHRRGCTLLRPAPTKPVIAWPDASSYYSPDCNARHEFPPVGGMIEGSPTADYNCDHNNNDCHLLVVQGSTLYEAYAANVTASGVEAICALTWDLNKVSPPEAAVSSASVDAAGFPVAPLLFSADDVMPAMQGTQRRPGPRHSIRAAQRAHRQCALRAQSGLARHQTAGWCQWSRQHAALRGAASEVDLQHGQLQCRRQSDPRTMQRYGIVLADGGNIALTAEDDRFNTHKWRNSGVPAQIFNSGTGNPAVQVTDFEVVETGSQKVVTYDCVRIPDDFIYIDHFSIELAGREARGLRNP